MGPSQGRVRALSGSAGAPEVSVVVVSYRCADLLAECLGSLDDQRADVDLEVDVIDNASGDDTLEAAAAFPWARREGLAENVGFARANNHGLARAGGRAVLILNPDTVLPPGSLRACLDELWSRPDVGLLTPRLVTRGGDLDRRCKRGFPTPWSSLCYFTGLDRRLGGPRSTRYVAGWLPEDHAGEVEGIAGAFMLARGDALRSVGGFDEQFFMYAEDLDLCLRFIAEGWKVRYWPGVDVVHVGAGSSDGGVRPPAADAAYFRTMAPFIRKHRPGARGLALSAAVAGVSEVMLAASMVRARRARAARNGAPDC